MRPSHALFFVAGVIATTAHQSMDAQLIWAAIGIGGIAIWSVIWEGLESPACITADGAIHEHGALTCILPSSSRHRTQWSSSKSEPRL